mmetsp:Transcript_63977/g.187692  ORF Transcript_63977/g.187692 Transcript_63977/m.187692 type:complete len:275 (-) Transcript_63977:131-955(-)
MPVGRIEPWPSMARLLPRVALVSLLCNLVAVAGHSDARQAEKTEAPKPEMKIEQCTTVVQKVTDKKEYSEEAILDICNQETRWKGCDFFSEALSLASTHNNFTSDHFCGTMDEAQLCSRIMDKLLMSIPVSDLAFGECIRMVPERGYQYCQKFRNMLTYGVKNEALDTLRTCYIVQEYTNEQNGTLKELEAPEAEAAAARMRIITGETTEIAPFGNFSQKPKKPIARIVDGNIVIQPQPFDRLGDGKGNYTAPTNTIITAPVPVPLAPAAAAPG